MCDSVKMPDESKSIREKRVLELAKAYPDASLSKIAENVVNATPEYVDQVLTQYGDPATIIEE